MNVLPLNCRVAPALSEHVSPVEGLEDGELVVVVGVVAVIGVVTVVGVVAVVGVVDVVVIAVVVVVAMVGVVSVVGVVDVVGVVAVVVEDTAGARSSFTTAMLPVLLVAVLPVFCIQELPENVPELQALFSAHCAAQSSRSVEGVVERVVPEYLINEWQR